MLNLKDIRKKTSQQEDSEEQRPEVDLKPLEIGFKVESKLDITKRNLRKRFHFFVEELKVSGFYTNFWMWNFIFLNLLGVFMFLVLIGKYNATLPGLIGINTDSDWAYDITIPKSSLYFVPIFHVLIVIISIVFSIKSHRKLSQLYLAAFFQVLVLMIFEFLGVRNLIVYFL